MDDDSGDLTTEFNMAAVADVVVVAAAIFFEAFPFASTDSDKGSCGSCVPL
jgi:hypothetical protein